MASMFAELEAIRDYLIEKIEVLKIRNALKSKDEFKQYMGEMVEENKRIVASISQLKEKLERISIKGKKFLNPMDEKKRA